MWEYFSDIKKIYKTHTFLYISFIFLLTLVLWIYIFLLADPRYSYIEKQKPRSGVDIAVVLDVSYSMEAKDIAPNRITVAKTVLSQFFEKMEGHRVSLVLFSWRPFASIPLTFDYPFLVEFIKNSSTSTINQYVTELQWTALWDAMILASTQLFPKQEKDDEKREKIMILLTDGEANKWIDPTLALKLLKEKWVKVYTVWVGWENKTFVEIMDPLGRLSNVEIGPVDEAMLKKISSETGWKYFKASDWETFKSIFDTISALEKKEIVVESREVKVPFYDFFIVVLLFFHIWIFYFYFKNIKV